VADGVRSIATAVLPQYSTQVNIQVQVELRGDPGTQLLYVVSNEYGQLAIQTLCPCFLVHFVLHFIF